jgi:hypothetical protein
MFEIVQLGKLCKQNGKLRSCQKSLELVSSDPDSASPKEKISPKCNEITRGKMEPMFEIVQMGKLCTQSEKLSDLAQISLASAILSHEKRALMKEK